MAMSLGVLLLVIYHISDLNNRNKFLTAKISAKHFFKFYRGHYELVEKSHKSEETSAIRYF